MYTIKRGSDIIYDPTQMETYPVHDITLDMAISAAGSLKFTMEPTHPLYNKLNQRKDVITVMQENDIIWRGSVTDSNPDFNNDDIINCEGQLSYLCDSVLRPYEFNGTPRQYLNMLINQHNNQMDNFKQFSLGTVVVDEAFDTIYRANSDYTKTWDEITAKLLNMCGGFIVPTYNANGTVRIDYLDEPVNICSQAVEYGENLIDLQRSISSSGVFTVLIPTGKKETEATSTTTTTATNDILTIESVNGGKDYIENASAVNTFGRIVEHIHYSELTTASAVKAKGQKDLSKNLAKSTTLTVSAYDLHNLNVNVERFRLGYNTQIKSTPHNVNLTLIASAMSLVIDAIEESTYTFGKVQEKLTEQQHKEQVSNANALSETETSINERADATEGHLGDEANTRYNDDQTLEQMIDDLAELIGAEGVVPEGKTVLEYAQEEATRLITEGVEGGYVFIDENCVRIMNTKDINTATSIWEWTSGGLGWRASKNGASQVAMYVNPRTGKGCITGDMITAGKVLAEFIALFGKMAVYRTNTINNNNVGGYIGYFAGDDGSSTTGIAMTPASGSNKIAVSTGGASINGGTPFFSIPNRCQCGGNLTVTGNLTVNGNIFTGRTAHGANLNAELTSIWNEINSLWANKASVNHTHSS